MYFEKCSNCTPGEWAMILIEDLVRELAQAFENPSQMLDLMVVQKAVVRTATAKYRRYIPTPVKDWAKP